MSSDFIPIDAPLDARDDDAVVPQQPIRVFDQTVHNPIRAFKRKRPESGDEGAEKDASSPRRARNG